MSRQYDIVVVGGGIHGVGVAQAAAASGYSVLVLEQKGLASGTSSRSSKLIHGGLRYLESGQLAVVRECLRERSLLLKLAPDLVRLVPFYTPIFNDTRRRPWQIRIGLAAYGILTGFDSSGKFAQVPKARWSDLDGLRLDRLDAVYRFSDAQTDDTLLTRAVMQSASSLGAELAMPAKLYQIELTGDGCIISYRQGDRDEECRAHLLINAGGPWVNEVLKLVSPAPSRLKMELVQGTHLILPGKMAQGVFYVEAPHDHRGVFLIPWGENTMVGTTEVPYSGDPSEVHPLEGEQEYLLEVAGHYFPRFRGVKPISAFAGLRVLPSGGDIPFSRSRETIPHPDREKNPRVLTIYGGKLTAYRASAQRVMERLRPTLPERRPIADTCRLPLTHPDL